MSSEIILLIKIFDNEEYADAFINEGKMYCRTLETFKGIDDDGVRGDKFEAASCWYQPDQITMDLSYVDDKNIKKSIQLTGADLAGPIVMQPSIYNHLNLYCMYAVKKPEFHESYETEEERILAVEKINTMLQEIITLDDDALSLGEFSVIVFKTQDFIEKVKQTLVDNKYKCNHNLVQYFDPETFNGDFNELETVFRKRKIYEPQNEYRFVIQPPESEPIAHKTIYIGSLEGIAVKVPTRKINSAMHLKLATPTND